MSAPSGYTALDFVGFTDKGTYSPIVNYMRNDLVHYGGNIMRCLIDNTKNVTPVVGANWELWVGASANLVERVIAPLENNPADVAFGVGRQIIYDDWLWEVIAPIEVGDALIDYDVDPTNANIKKSAPVETQLLAVKAEADATDNMIAPTEASASSSSAAYSIGDQLILNNILYDVIADIQIGDALTTGTGGNIAAADTLTDQIKAKANSSDLGTAAAKDSTNAVTSGSTDLVESGAVASELATIDSSIQTLTNQIDIIESSVNWRTGLRFKNLGTSFTSAQQTALTNGDFSEFWNGDYWVIGGHNWRIVDNSGIARRKGDTNFDRNSLVIMPDDNLVVAEAYLIDDANDSGHGYNNCAYRTRTDGKGRAQCKSIISSAFGSSHIASHRELMSSARGTSGATSWAWTDADVELPSEANIYGHSAWSSGITSGCYSPGYNIGTEWGQFMLFRLAPYMAINRNQNYWLRDIASASYFAGVDNGGYASSYTPSSARVGLRPHFILV